MSSLMCLVGAISGHAMRQFCCRWAVAVAVCAAVTACGTGIEVTERVTDKDVRRVIDQADSHQPQVTLNAYRDSLPAWQPGKRFWVADDRVKQLFVSTRDYDIDTVRMAGHELSFVGYNTGGLYDNRSTVNLMFGDEAGRTFVYRTGKTIEEFNSGFAIPMLIDMDMVGHIARQVVGKDYYIRTPIWYDRLTEQMINGRHFIKVHIDNVMPGNAVMPLRLLFTTADDHQPAMVWMSDNSSVMRGRDFDALFTAADPHLSHPAITPSTWSLITRGEVAIGMNKEECLLSLGNPNRISTNPDQGGLREYWYYDGGSYLYFVDGLLNQFRR